MARKDDQDGATPEQPEEGRAEGRGPAGGDEFVSMEGPDVETPTGDSGSGDGPEFSADDLSFLEDVSAGTATAPTPTQEDEHLADLKRVTAEYANYRRRTEANRQIERDRAVGDVVKLLLPVLDDLDRAEKHGDLAEGGALTTIASKLRASGERLGLIAFGGVGELFDPAQHEAIFQKPNPDVTAATVADVVERGYRIGDVTLRAAKVVVDTPAD
jgi:molecular chaperone GrpE